MTADLVAFLRARLDDDERIARAVEDRSAPWTGQWENDNGRALRTHNGHVLAYLPDARPFKPGVLDHIARHDPARVLADTDAKRQIVDWLADTAAEFAEIAKPDGYQDPERGQDMGTLTEVARLLALPYAAHPDYRKEWRP